MKIPGLALGGAGLGHAFGTRPAQMSTARSILGIPEVQEWVGKQKLDKPRQALSVARDATRDPKIRGLLSEEQIKGVGGRGLQGLYDDVSRGASKSFSWLTGGGPGGAVESAKSNLVGKREAIRGILGNKDIGRGAKATQLAGGGARVLDKAVRRGGRAIAKHPRTAGAALALTAAPAAWEHIAKPIGRSIPNLMTFGDR